MKTGMLRHSVLAIAAAAALAAAPTSPAQAAIVIFDDADGTGWSRQWYTPTQTTTVHTGTTALETSNGQYRFDHAGIVDADNYILEFYVNTKDATPGTNLIVLLNYVLEDTTVEPGIPFDNRNVPVTYVIDDVNVAAGTSASSSPKGVDTDGDTQTWQKIQLDLSQTTYTGFPYVAHNYVPGSSTLTRISIQSAGGTPGSIANLAVDNVRLTAVPEPASAGLLAAGLVGLLGRRSRQQA